jgi:hypothetical protein
MVAILIRSSFKTVGDCPDFAQSSEQNGTGTIRLGLVPLSAGGFETTSTQTRRVSEVIGRHTLWAQRAPIRFYWEC